MGEGGCLGFYKVSINRVHLLIHWPVYVVEKLHVWNISDQETQRMSLSLPKRIIHDFNVQKNINRPASF